MPKLFHMPSPEAQRALLQRRASLTTLDIARYALIRGAIFAILFVVLQRLFADTPTNAVQSYILGFLFLTVSSFFIIMLERRQARRTLERIHND